MHKFGEFGIFRMYRNCCVPTCTSLRKDIKFHRFPFKDENKKQWLKLINSKDIMNSDVSKLYVCHKHFEKRFVNVATNRLKSGAYPSLFTPTEISSGTPTNSCLESVNATDHEYSRKPHIDHSYALPIEQLYKHSDTEDYDIDMVPATVQTVTTDSPSSHNVSEDIEMVPTTVQAMITEYCPNLNVSEDIDMVPTTVQTITTQCVSYLNVSDIETDHEYSRKPHIDHSYALPIEQLYKHSDTEDYDIDMVPATVQTVTTDSPSSHNVSDIDMVPATVQTVTTDRPSSLNVSEDTDLPTTVQSITRDCFPNLNVSETSGKFARKLVKKRLVRDEKSLTPRCKLLYREYKKARRQNNYKSRSKRALAFSKEKSLEELMRNMNPVSRKILWMQVKLCTKRNKARRFTIEEKLIALSIYKQGPKSYKFLRKIFILPSTTTLKKMISQLDVGPGINPQIFEHIKNQIKKWDSKKLLCTIMFDEMALETALTYSSTKDNIFGFVDLNGKTKQFADHALVFMLRGAVCKWQQPLAFYFCEGATPSMQLKVILKDIVSAVTDTGLKPIALVSDQGSSFQSAINDLLGETKRDQLRAGERVDDTIHLSGNSLSVFYDPPHLIKGIRNNLLSKDMLFEGKRAKWQDIVDVYNADCKHGESRILHKLTDQHVIPEKIKKMKVSNCVRVISKTVSAALSYTSTFPLYPDGSPVSKTLKNTAEAISFFDDLFDSVNGASTSHKNTKGKNLRKAVTAKTNHHKFWDSAVKILESTKFIAKDNKVKSVPSIKNWVISLNSFKRVWSFLNAKKIKIMRPRYFNSDPIENFFGQVRAYNYRSNNPSPYAFVNTFKSLLITRFINFHSESFNCEEDISKDLLSIKSLFNRPMEESTANISSNKDDNIAQKNFDQVLIQVQARRERINVHSRAYTTGWVTRKILTKISCNNCRKNLITDSENMIHDYIKHREYKSIKQKKLCYPSEYAVRSFGYVCTMTNEYLESHGHHAHLRKKIKQSLYSKYSFSFLNCELHREIVLDYFLDITITLFIFNWCNVINKILKGTDLLRLEKKELPPMQQNALNKYKKKFKNKGVNK